MSRRRPVRALAVAVAVAGVLLTGTAALASSPVEDAVATFDHTSNLHPTARS